MLKYFMAHLISAKSSVGWAGVVESWEDLDEVVVAVLLVLHLEGHEAQMNIFTWKGIINF